MWPRLQRLAGELLFRCSSFVISRNRPAPLAPDKLDDPDRNSDRTGLETAGFCARTRKPFNLD